MTDLLTVLGSLRRPRLLIRAARFGLADYRRERDLRRLVGAAMPTTTESALNALMEREHRMEATRRTGEGAYSIARHVELLIAIMAEARLLPDRQPGTPR